MLKPYCCNDSSVQTLECIKIPWRVDERTHVKKFRGITVCGRMKPLYPPRTPTAQAATRLETVSAAYPSTGVGVGGARAATLKKWPLPTKNMVLPTWASPLPRATRSPLESEKPLPLPACRCTGRRKLPMWGGGGVPASSRNPKAEAAEAVH